MKIRLYKFLVLSFIFLLFFMSCKKDFEFNKIKPLTWRPDLAIPLVKDGITFEMALKETGGENNFYIDDAGDISMLYYFRDNAFHISPGDLLTIPSFPFSYNHQFTTEEQQIISTQDMNITPVDYVFNLAENDPNVEIDKLLVKEGTVVVNMNNTFNNDGHFVIRFLNATKNGIPFSHITGPFITGSSSDTIDLSNVLFDLLSSPNRITVRVECLLKKSDRPIANDMILDDFTLKIPKVGRFEGYLGQRTFNPNQASVKVTVFNNAYTLGDVYFEDPKASITLVNSIGVPARITIRKLKATNSVSGFSQDITDKLGENAVFSVPSPSITATEPVLKSVDYSNANTGNSMDVLFNIKPDYVFYQITAEINPTKRGINFFTDTSSMYANLLVKLPLYGHFDHLTVQDTFAFSMNKQKEIESANFKTNIVNGFPLQAKMQVYFTDKTFHKIDSMAGNNCIMIKEAPVDPVTHLPQPGMFGEKDTSFFYDRQRMDNLVNADYILVRAVLNSFDEGSTNVKIKATQTLKLNFSAEVKLKKNLETGKK